MFFPDINGMLPPLEFDQLIAKVGQRTAWMKSHTCPCVFGGGGPNGRLPLPGAPQRSCQKCFGVGIYWDAPSPLFIAFLKYIEMSPTPDEPGTRMNPMLGMVQLSEPSITVPFSNPFLAFDDPGQPRTVWADASIDDIFVPVDMLVRYTANLQTGGIDYLPFQQNMQIAPAGAVTVFDPVTSTVNAVTNYTVSGAQVTITGYPVGTNYMVEFQAAPLYVVFRPAGGMPHVRPLGGGIANEPRRFKVQSLDFWTRQRGPQPRAAGMQLATGMMLPAAIMTGAAS